MNVLILNPGSELTKNIVRDVLYGCWCKGKMIGGATVPPTPMLLIASVLDKINELSVEFIDAASEPIVMDEFKRTIKAMDIVVISTAAMTFSEDMNLLKSLKKLNPVLKTVVFGMQSTFLPEETLKRDEVDFIIIREPEQIIYNLMIALLNDYALEDVKGIGFKKGSELIFTEPQELQYNMEALPYINLKLFPKKANYFNPIIKRWPYITMETSRGCPFKCLFCTSPVFYGNKVRFQRAERVVDEMEYYVKNGFREIYFRDETFTFSKERTIKISKLIIDRGLDVSWICNSRVDTIDEETMVLMKKAGCHTIKFGVETGNQELLDSVNKGITIEQTERVFKATNKLGIWSHAHMMLGLPGETDKTIHKTYKFIRKIRPTTITYSVYEPYVGTPVYFKYITEEKRKMFEKYLNLKTLHDKAYANELFTELENKKIERYVHLGYLLFYINPLNILRIIKHLNNFEQFFRILKAATKIYDYVIRGE